MPQPLPQRSHSTPSYDPHREQEFVNTCGQPVPGVLKRSPCLPPAPSCWHVNPLGLGLLRGPALPCPLALTPCFPGQGESPASPETVRRLARGPTPRLQGALIWVSWKEVAGCAWSCCSCPEVSLGPGRGRGGICSAQCCQPTQRRERQGYSLWCLVVTAHTFMRRQTCGQVYTAQQQPSVCPPPSQWSMLLRALMPASPGVPQSRAWQARLCWGCTQEACAS